MPDAKGSDQLVFSRPRVVLTNTAFFLFLFIAVVPVTLALGIGFLVAATDAGDVVGGIVFLVVAVFLAIVLTRAALRRSRRALLSLPLIEATLTDFHLRDVAGEDHWVKRSRTASAAWRYIAGSGSPILSELDFFARSGEPVGSWAIPPNVGRPVLRWLRAHNVPARMMRNRAALAGAPPAPGRNRKQSRKPW